MAENMDNWRACELMFRLEGVMTAAETFTDCLAKNQGMGWQAELQLSPSDVPQIVGGYTPEGGGEWIQCLYRYIDNSWTKV